MIAPDRSDGPPAQSGCLTSTRGSSGLAGGWICSSALRPKGAKRIPATAGQARQTSARRLSKGRSARVVFAGRGGEFTVARLRSTGVPAAGHRRRDPARGAGRGPAAGARPARDRPPLRPAAAVDRLHRGGARRPSRGIKRYLGSGLIKGIGPEFAGAHRRHLRHPDPGDPGRRAGPHRRGARHRPGAGAVGQGGLGAPSARSAQVMVFLQGYGVSPAFAARIYKRYGASAIARVRENPYRLAFDVWGIGFLSADKLAMALGIARDAEVRLEAGVRHVLDEAGSAGHCYVPRDRGWWRRRPSAWRWTPTAVRPAIERLARGGRSGARGDRQDDCAVFDAEPLPGRTRGGGRPAAAGQRSGAGIVRGTLRGSRTRDELRVAKPRSAHAPGGGGGRGGSGRVRAGGRHRAGPPAGRGDPAGPAPPGGGHHRRARGRQDDHRARRSSASCAGRAAGGAGGAHRPGRQAADRGHRPAGGHLAPAAGVAARRTGASAATSSARWRPTLLVVDEASMLDVRLAADLVAALPSGHAPGAGGRRGPAALGRAGRGAGAT